jgi:hypothetical protein
LPNTSQPTSGRPVGDGKGDPYGKGKGKGAVAKGKGKGSKGGYSPGKGKGKGSKGSYSPGKGKGKNALKGPMTPGKGKGLQGSMATGKGKGTKGGNGKGGGNGKRNHGGNGGKMQGGNGGEKQGGQGNRKRKRNAALHDEEEIRESDDEDGTLGSEVRNQRSLQSKTIEIDQNGGFPYQKDFARDVMGEGRSLQLFDPIDIPRYDSRIVQVIKYVRKEKCAADVSMTDCRLNIVISLSFANQDLSNSNSPESVSIFCAIVLEQGLCIATRSPTPAPTPCIPGSDRECCPEGFDGGFCCPPGHGFRPICCPDDNVTPECCPEDHDNPNCCKITNNPSCPSLNPNGDTSRPTTSSPNTPTGKGTVGKGKGYGKGKGKGSKGKGTGKGKYVPGKGKGKSKGNKGGNGKGKGSGKGNKGGNGEGKGKSKGKAGKGTKGRSGKGNRDRKKDSDKDDTEQGKRKRDRKKGNEQGKRKRNRNADIDAASAALDAAAAALDRTEDGEDFDTAEDSEVFNATDGTENILELRNLEASQPNEKLELSAVVLSLLLDEDDGLDSEHSPPSPPVTYSETLRTTPKSFSGALREFECTKEFFECRDGDSKCEINEGCGKNVPSGYYPDLRAPASYCFCPPHSAPEPHRDSFDRGTNTKSIAARYASCDFGLVWDNHALPRNGIRSNPRTIAFSETISYLPGKYGIHGLWGTDGGGCVDKVDLSLEGRRISFAALP